MDHKFCAEYGDILIRPLRRYDIEPLRQWRNKENISRFLRPVGQISKSQQENWFEQYIHNKDVLFFVADYKRFRSVGTVALYSFVNDECEIGKLVIGEDSAKGNGLGESLILMSMCIGILYLKQNKFSLVVNKMNLAARHIYKNIGFVEQKQYFINDTDIEIRMEIERGCIMCNSKTKDINLFEENNKIVRNLGGGILPLCKYLFLSLHSQPCFLSGGGLRWN